MIRVSTILGASLAVGGLLTVGAAALRAQEDPEGIIRVSDCMPGQSAAGGAVGTNCPSTVAGTPSMVYSGSVCPDGGGYGYGQCSNCGYGHGRCRCAGKLCAIFHPHRGCTVSPDHGWAPPGKVALWRRPVAYNKYFPDKWMGYSAGASGQPLRQVYMPTDTTQLGYYYQHVPHWHPNPGMIPPAPNPNDWHQPLMGAANGPIVGDGYVVGGTPGCPVEQGSSTIVNPTPAAPMPPAPEELVDPTPPPPEAASAADLQKHLDAPALQPTPGQSAGA